MTEIADFHIVSLRDQDFLQVIGRPGWWAVTPEMVSFMRQCERKSVSAAIASASRRLGPAGALDVYQSLSATDVFVPQIGRLTPDPSGPSEVTAIQLHVTHSCNLGCTYCYAGQGNYGGPTVHMKWPVARQAVDWLLEASGERPEVRISFFGGEPMLNLKLIRRVVPYARERAVAAGKTVRFGMTTNGTMLTDTARAYLNDNKIRFMVSLDGPRDVHDKFRKTKKGEPTFDRIAAAIEAQARTGVPVSVRATHADPDSDLRRTYAVLNDMPIQNGFVAHVGNPGRAYFEKVADENDAILDEEIAHYRDTGKLRHSPFRKQIDHLQTGEISVYPCGGGRSFLSVTPDGSLYFCHRFANDPEQKLGTVFDGAVASPTAHLSVEDREPCRSCAMRYYCSGQCYQECSVSDGEFRPEPEFCTYFHKLMGQTLYLAWVAGLIPELKCPGRLAA